MNLAHALRDGGHAQTEAAADPRTMLAIDAFGYPARRRYADCSNCKRQTRHVTQWDGVWYGTTTWCYSCGQREQDGFITPANAEAKSLAGQKWRDAVRPRVYEKFVSDAIRAEFA